jgi:hypothetical protein
LGERFNGIEEVGGSIPPGSTSVFNVLGKPPLILCLAIFISYKLATAKKLLPARASNRDSIALSR